MPVGDALHNDRIQRSDLFRDVGNEVSRRRICGTDRSERLMVRRQLIYCQSYIGALTIHLFDLSIDRCFLASRACEMEKSLTREGEATPGLLSRRTALLVLMKGQNGYTT